jgi:hypothetical protein
MLMSRWANAREIAPSEPGRSLNTRYTRSDSASASEAAAEKSAATESAKGRRCVCISRSNLAWMWRSVEVVEIA